MTITVLYEDNHLLVVDKPAGLLTQPSGTDLDSLENQAKIWIKEKHDKPGNVFLEAVHRLDRPVSGIVLFAKTSKALSRLNASVRNKETTKTYMTIIEGILDPTEGTLENYTVHDHHKAKIVDENYPDSKVAILEYKTIKTTDNQSLIEISLITGRYHQIRAQFSSIGNPIVGDEKYGSSVFIHHNVIYLHHSNLTFSHPISQKTIECSSFPSFSL